MSVDNPYQDALSPPVKYAFNQWQVWAVLLFAGLSGYLSLMVHSVVLDQSKLEGVIESVASINRNTNLVDDGTSRWLVDVSQVMPQLEYFASNSAAAIADSLHQIMTKLSTEGKLPPAEQIGLRQELIWVLADLQTQRAVLSMSESRTTHFYYWSVIAFVLALTALLRKRRIATEASPMRHLLMDSLLFPNTPMPLMVSDSNDRLLRVNKAFEEATGYKGDVVLGQIMISESLDHDEGIVDQMRLTMAESGRWVGEYRQRNDDGSVKTKKVMRIALGDDLRQPAGYLTMSLDPVVSDDEQKLMLWQAHHDNLTKLPNANLLHERISRALILSEQEGKRGAIISIDLDNFQSVNDSIGHANGDRVLTDAAYRIAMAVRETDTVARVGGDLFVIALNEIEDVSEVERMARSLVEAFGAPFITQDKELFMSASVGIAIFPDDGMEKGELLQKADAARINAKQRGGNQITFFEEEMNSAAARRLEIETCLRRAVDNNEFKLHYQPIIDIGQASVYGAEALLRWNSPELGFVSPVEFIPVAEDSGLIVKIGGWVIGEVQRQLKSWQEAGLPDLRVSVNVSARQFSNEQNAQDLLAALGSSFAEQITVEITESALVSDDQGAMMFLQGIKAHGLKIALDDFGTGYSSIGYLRDFSFDVLKIDKSFIDGLYSPRDFGLVASIISMGRILGMQIVAEGVEEENQLKQLQRIGCDFVQGYFYSKPLAAEEFEAFVADPALERSSG